MLMLQVMKSFKVRGG